MPAETAAIRTARPTIKIAGRESAALAQGLLRLRIEENGDGLYACEATFGNWGPSGGEPGFLYFDRRTLDFGREFTVALGEGTLFAGRITGLEASYPDGRAPELTVLAEDRLQDLRMTRRTRSFADVSDADVVRRLAGEHGLTPDVDVSGPTHKVLAQLDQSDLAFLRDRARAVGAELWVSDRTLAVKRRSGRNGGRLRLAYGRELLELRVLADLAHQRTAVTVSGWDVAAKRALSERADSSVVAGEIGDGDGGADILAGALAERRETAAATAPLAAAEARARAEALFRERARRFVAGRGIAQTDPALRAGATVQLDALGPLFSGDYYLAAVVHRFDTERGLQSELALERPGLGRAA